MAHPATASQARSVASAPYSDLARELHDHAVQQLFSVGLELEAVSRSLPQPQADHLLNAVEALDSVVSELRVVIFALSHPRDIDSIRRRILDAVEETHLAGLSTPSLAFVGPVDLVIRGSLADHVTELAGRALTMLGSRLGGAVLRLTAEAGHVDLDFIAPRGAAPFRELGEIGFTLDGTARRMRWSEAIPATAT